MKQFFLITLHLIVLISYSQNVTLNKKWVWDNNPNCNKPEVLQPHKNWIYDFLASDTLKISRLFPDYKSSKVFKLDGNKIITQDVTYQIKKLTTDTLLLQLPAEGSCGEMHFVSYHSLIDTQKENYFIHNSDTVYTATFYNFPLLDNIHYKSKVATIVNRLIRDTSCEVNISFIVTSDGYLIGKKGKTDCKKNTDKFITKLYDLIEENWSPMKINGKPVSTYVRVDINNKKYNLIGN
ncbi:hypothetical protein SAMN05421640_1281 [Ekhidna lutea]|uniref:TonB protein C-terminal n=1 Tax=Ekhidna lutea TaxID=447679 RepID=A0A239HG08_EKHLU|nr:hypothetical protein [Ekhidna lutea]SNS79978.1 hypothetical protein SAMN05421640_1281 [Ekhidna lutea]